MGKKNIELSLDRTDFFAGAIVRGKVTVTVAKPKKYQRVVVKLWGGSNVYWEVHSNTGDNNHHVDVYRNSRTYIRHRQVLWEPENSPTGDLPIGQHHFPFRFRLPRDGPPSFEGAHGWVRYELEAKTLSQGLIDSNIKSTATRLIIKDRVPEDYRLLYRDPKTVEGSKNLSFLCFSSGMVSTTVRIPRTGFAPGETIPMSVHVSNESSKQIRVASALQRRDTFISTCGRRNFGLKTYARTLSSPIVPGVVTQYKDRNLIVPSDVAIMRHCAIIKVQYVVVIKVLTPWYCSNMEMELPISVAYFSSTSSEEQQQQQQQEEGEHLQAQLNVDEPPSYFSLYPEPPQSKSRTTTL